jgi:hypothetical protein
MSTQQRQCPMRWEDHTDCGLRRGHVGAHAAGGGYGRPHSQSATVGRSQSGAAQTLDTVPKFSSRAWRRLSRPRSSSRQ